MQISNIPIISDPHYITSRVYKDITESVCTHAARSRLTAEIILIDKKDIDWSALPPAVIVTPGSISYLKNVIYNLRQAGKRIILAGLDSDAFGIDISCVSPGRYFDSFRLIRYLQHYGRGRIALAGFRKDDITDMTRHSVAINTINAFGEGQHKDQSFFWNKDLTACLEDFLSRAGDFNAVVCPNDPVAIRLIRLCAEHGISIPGDLYMASFSIMRISRFIKPGITTIAMDFPAVGRHILKIFQYVVDNLESEIALKIHVPSSLVVRLSTENKPEKALDSVIRSYNYTDIDKSNTAFLEDDLVRDTLRLENCLSRRDDLDLKILNYLYKGLGYEAIAEKLFISPGGIRYRISKIYKDANAANRSEFENLIRETMGAGNPFSDY
jgi:DNA-binding LacI/PurR family transcriptional regulator/DNA-binding CsgD family transcriptional regulator